MKELLKKLRKYEVYIRKVVKSRKQGDFHSIFKGSGLEFDDVRAYQYGDDVRTIDWNVTAKGHGTFVKTFKEEKEQTVYFILDVSASQDIGVEGKKKSDIGKEICGVLTLSSVKEQSEVGLICYSDQKEKYIRPGKGSKHAYEIIMSMFNLKPKSLKTDLSKAMGLAMNIIKRRSVVILISDFIDENIQHNFTALAKKHDVVAIHIIDQRETHLPNLGIIPLYDKESGKTLWINTSSNEFKRNINANHFNKQDILETFCRKHQVNYLPIYTHEDYVPKLIKLFKVRNKTKKSA
ncbi:DUF58 domain-containing protein [Fulvivirgaceae bacterium BMA10]|uniref:DUF58 domain-containing protein n=1 Tax=Splendidivirga corallicola TaxID=3051826 RepID=A0ABT8KPD5_9BACT|nr:DUF58 domain-containing protein [Fulvivirgaceae bacterium BMA10]